MQIKESGGQQLERGDQNAPTTLGKWGPKKIKLYWINDQRELRNQLEPHGSVWKPHFSCQMRKKYCLHQILSFSQHLLEKIAYKFLITKYLFLSCENGLRLRRFAGGILLSNCMHTQLKYFIMCWKYIYTTDMCLWYGSLSFISVYVSQFDAAEIGSGGFPLYVMVLLAVIYWFLLPIIVPRCRLWVNLYF